MPPGRCLGAGKHAWPEPINLGACIAPTGSGVPNSQDGQASACTPCNASERQPAAAAHLGGGGEEDGAADDGVQHEFEAVVCRTDVGRKMHGVYVRAVKTFLCNNDMQPARGGNCRSAWHAQHARLSTPLLQRRSPLNLSRQMIMSYRK